MNGYAAASLATVKGIPWEVISTHGETIHYRLAVRLSEALTNSDFSKRFDFVKKYFAGHNTDFRKMTYEQFFYNFIDYARLKHQGVTLQEHSEIPKTEKLCWEFGFKHLLSQIKLQKGS